MGIYGNACVLTTSVGLIHDLVEQLFALFACPDRHIEHVDVSAAPSSVAFGALGICPRTTCQPHVQCQQGTKYTSTFFMVCQSSAKRAVPDGHEGNADDSTAICWFYLAPCIGLVRAVFC